MTAAIAAFFVLGACFGLATWSNRHLFSEGPTRPGMQAPSSFLDSRFMWVLICSTLWPLMALTGVHSVWRLARARAPAPRDRMR